MTTRKKHKRMIDAVPSWMSGILWMHRRVRPVNERKTMKTPVKSGEVSHTQSLVNDAEHGGGSEKAAFDVRKWLAKANDGVTIAKMRTRMQFNP